MIEDKLILKQCDKKKHTFIPSSWLTQGNKKVAVQFVCQNCLIAVDKSEVETANHHHCHEIEKTKTTE